MAHSLPLEKIGPYVYCPLDNNIGAVMIAGIDVKNVFLRFLF